MRRRQGQLEQPCAPVPGRAALRQYQLQEELDGDLISRRMLLPRASQTCRVLDLGLQHLSVGVPD